MKTSSFAVVLSGALLLAAPALAQTAPDQTVPAQTAPAQTAPARTAATDAAPVVQVLSWGGDFSAAQAATMARSFTAAKAVEVRFADSDDPAGVVKTQVEAGNVTTDVVDIEYPDAIRLCDEGLLEPIDPAGLPAAPDGTPATEDFLPNALAECAVGSIVFSTVYAYDTTKITADPPTTIADFFDTAKYPGKRGLKRAPKALLEMALMGDGVPADEVYKVLGTPEGVDRAFKKLDTIKKDVVWWEAGAQPPQLLADGEVVMSTAYTGRIFAAAIEENKPFQIVWDGQTYENEMYVVPKGAPNVEQAMDYIRFATSTEGLRSQAALISYGPPRKSANVDPIIYKDGKTEMGPHLPTAEVNMANALQTSAEFWVDHDAEFNERFQAWLTQ